GIFTVRQLSYLFRPRRKRKNVQDTPEQHRLELQALALRTDKTYQHELPVPDRQPVELFLDIEGVPDRHLYYLIGLLVCEDGHTSYVAFCECPRVLWHAKQRRADGCPKRFWRAHAPSGGGSAPACWRA